MKAGGLNWSWAKLLKLIVNDVVLHKKKILDDALSYHYSLSSLIFSQKVVWVATFQVHLMPHMSIKFDNSWTKMITQ
jgi:hypothetical protein